MDRKQELLLQSLGVQRSYIDIFGNQNHVSPDTAREILKVFGFDSATEDAWEQLKQQRRQQRFPGTEVFVRNQPVIFFGWLPASVSKKPFSWEVSSEEQQGIRQSSDATVECLREVSSGGEILSRVKVSLPLELKFGYYNLALTFSDEQTSTIRVIVGPEQAYIGDTDRVLRCWGVHAQLYNLRSDRSWGIGDFGDLQQMQKALAKKGASFIGVNPLHSLGVYDVRNVSPYSPSSRVFHNFAYLDIESLDDWRELNSSKVEILSDEERAEIERLKKSDRIPYERVFELKRKALEALFGHFYKNHFQPVSKRAKAFISYCKEGGEPLFNYALFEALREAEASRDVSAWGWPAWQQKFQDKNSDAIEEFAEGNETRVLFFQYVQWLAASQLAELQNHEIGLYMDLALSADIGGADVWLDKDCYALEMQVGAPPDDYNRQGQNWGFPPLVPQKMRADGYRPFIRALRSVMRYSSIVRLDHVMSLMRLFWIPKGMPASAGAYIRYPFKDLLEIIKLESVRNKCIFVGEDLGTVPPGFREALVEAGILRYNVLFFMRDHAGGFLPPEQYPKEALVTSSTHDMAPFESFWQMRDIALRFEIGIISSEEERQEAESKREQEKRQLFNLLKERNYISGEYEEHQNHAAPELVAAVMSFLAATDCPLLDIPIEDILSDPTQVNMPGDNGAYESWCLRMKRPIEDLWSDNSLAPVWSALAMARPKDSN